MSIKSIVRKIPRKIKELLSQKRSSNSGSYPVTLYHKGTKKRKTVLFSYIPNSLLVKDQKSLTGHSNKWESREIAHILFNMGYDIDAISWSDDEFIPQKEYDVFFDICYNLSRLEKYFGENTKKLLHYTGSSPSYQNQAELKQVEEVNKRKNGNYIAKRLVNEPEKAEKSIIIADHISLLGNKHTLSTFSLDIQKKISLSTVSASDLGENIKNKSCFVPKKREFLWYSGSGAVHKGLDRLLEIFSRHPELTLHIVGNVAIESDFVAMYEEELYNKPNILYHGFLLPTSQEFKLIVSNTFCILSPSCSEGLSTAVVTCLQIGMFPIISHNTGISLPENCGIYLDSLKINDIEKAVLHSYSMNTSELMYQITTIQKFALKQYSRKKFSHDMKTYLQKVL